jgi:hypothetical protein
MILVGAERHGLSRKAPIGAAYPNGFKIFTSSACTNSLPQIT